ncbi:hypothetical protein SDC9_77338 [bioreactor metagenome]|uniref:Uncharacterized protein n=1 Tax=bioreactor metagenome TaxID=1076179 RepID=A0A644YS34_9ZZZZ
MVANRADETDAQGNVTSKHVGVRFPDAPTQMEKQTMTVKSNENPSVELRIKNNQQQNIKEDKQKQERTKRKNK